jgi:hypothetical protein
MLGYVVYCRVVGITTTVYTYIDIYCSLVSRTVVLNAATESHGLIRVCYWSQASSVYQSTGDEGMLVRLQLAAGPIVVLGMTGQCCVAGC